MKKKEVLKALEREFGENYLGDLHERMLYDHDTGTIPRWGRLILKTTPLAVVIPRNLPDLRKLVGFAFKNKLKLVPRGAGTSGYGGAIATKSEIMVDLSFINSIKSIDTERMTITVEPGVIWNKILQFLEPKGYSLPIYPSSAPAATVGGWIAEGGAGIGSAKYGFVQEQVISLEILTSSGDIFSTDNLNLYAEAEGTTGIIVSATLRILKLRSLTKLCFWHEEIEVLSSICNNLSLMSPYYVKLESPENVALKNLSESVKATKGFVLAVFEENDFKKQEIQAIANKFHAKLEDGEIEWKDRFNPQRLKKRGPSLIIGEALIPTKHLEKALTKVQNKFRREKVGLEATVISGGFCVIIAWFLDDERKRFFLFRWYRSFAVLDIAMKLGGRPYGVGIWFSGWVSKAFSKERLSNFQAEKRRVNSREIINPGKIWGPRVPFFFPILPLGWLMRFGKPFLRIAYAIFG